MIQQRHIVSNYLEQCVGLSLLNLVGALMAWLGEKVHSLGSSLSSEEILLRATGKPLDAEVFKDHLRHRYLPDG